MKNNASEKNRTGVPVEIKPVSFRPGRGGRPRKSYSRLKWLTGAAFAAFLVLLVAAVWFVFTARQVVIAIEPLPEKMTISGGVGVFKFGDHYLLRPGEYTLQAARQCYHQLNERFVVGDQKNQQLNFSMTELAGRLSFQVYRSDRPSVMVPGVRVFIDGKEAGALPGPELEAMSGRHVVEIRAPKYQDLKNEIDVEGCGIQQKLDFALIPGWSDIMIDSVPGEATVLVDGQAAGKTPLKIELPAGDHDIELKADGYKSYHSRLVVGANQPQVLKPIHLQPADGTLTVKTNPTGANVMLSNSFAGQTPISLSLPADKTHLIKLSKAGYETENREVTIGRAATKILNVKLKPKLGIIKLVVAPADALIFVDGKAMGRVPRQLRLLAVEHRLEIKKKGYQPYQTRITPRPGFKQEIRVTLVKQVIAGQKSADIISTKSGYRLKLIRPRPFTMGSSRREQGRRSNETMRSIQLQRPFFMGIREVTNREFRQFNAKHNSGTFKKQSLNLDSLPAVQVTWKQAALFCNWLSAKESLPPFYVEKAGKLIVANPLGIGYRLPTEAEWEYCARFNKDKSSLKYAWGNTFPPAGKAAGNLADISAKNLLSSYLQTYNDGHAVSAPPQKFAPSTLGLYDMGGNVAEWTHDFYSIYPYGANKVYTDPLGPNEGQHHVVRGSSWRHSGISELRLSYRDYSSTKRPDLGFRVCRYLK